MDYFVITSRLFIILCNKVKEPGREREKGVGLEEGDRVEEQEDIMGG
jgi:hypothetical protein